MQTLVERMGLQGCRTTEACQTDLELRWAALTFAQVSEGLRKHPQERLVMALMEGCSGSHSGCRTTVLTGLGTEEAGPDNLGCEVSPKTPVSSIPCCSLLLSPSSLGFPPLESEVKIIPVHVLSQLYFSHPYEAGDIIPTFEEDIEV